MKQVTKDTLKVVEVFRSCQTYDQYYTAYNMFRNLKKFHYKLDDELNELALEASIASHRLVSRT